MSNHKDSICALTGVLDKNVMINEGLEEYFILTLDGHGLIDKVFIKGGMLDDYQDSETIFVSGILKCRKQDYVPPAHFPPTPEQWVIFMDVSFCRRIDEPFST